MMSWLCEHGVHAYRTTAIEQGSTPQVLGHGPDPVWTVHEACKRCGWDRKRVVFRRPRPKAMREGDK